ncbi:MAG: bestrophin family ion channel [Segetibacter sp.]
MLLNKRIPIAYILNNVKFDLLFVLIVGFAVHYLTATFANWLPDMPLTIPAFLGTSISVLLSFKMGQSYDRWWEARKIWGAIVNDSRSFVIQLQSFINEKNTIKKMSFRHIAWCYSLGQSLRNQNPLDNLDPYLNVDDLKSLAKHNNKPLAILQQNAQEIRLLKQNNEIDIYTQIQIDNTLTRLCDAMGKAERINNTFFPTTYRLFLHFSIYLFVVILSIALKGVEIYFEIPLLLVISSVFFLIEKSAAHLQDPFSNRPSDTPVTSIARTIEINIKQLLDEKEIPQPLQPGKFFIL